MATLCSTFFIVLAMATGLFPFEYNAVAQYGDAEISLGLTFTENQSIQSQNGLFELGFFKPSAPNSSYLGIWHTMGKSLQTVVWVANRNRPAIGSASTFLLSSDGELMVHDSNKVVVWSSGTRGMNVSTAILTNTGNLVLQSGNSSFVWESFRHPTNVWLIGMEFRLGMKLVSWKTPIDPAEGPYSHQLLETGEFVGLWNGSRKYYSSGLWNGKIYSNRPEMSSDTMFNFSFHTKSGVTWSTKQNSSDYKIARLVLEPTGQTKTFIWMKNLGGWTLVWSQPSDPCDVYGTCGQYSMCNGSSSEICSCPSGFEDANPELWRSHNYFSGCKQQTPINCSVEGSNDVFVTLKNTSFDTEGFSHVLPGLTQSQCISSCLRDCSCNAYHYDKSAKNCSLESKILWVSSTFSSGAINLRVSARQFLYRGSPSGKRETSWVRIVVGAIIGCAVLIVILLGLLILRRIGARATVPRRYLPGVLNWFSYKQLQSVTRNFKESIGSGGFGAVFKGVLPDTTPVAVKRLNLSDQSEKQFRAEVSTIGIIQHVNLVRLLGFCSERSNRLLVLEYMPNGSLDRFLFRRKGATSKAVLDWGARFQIALGTARGIAYLHEACRECIIHCDIKPENILLDANLGAKVSDFGLAKLVGREYSNVLTSVRGTRGYLAPEWMKGLPVTAKADVYSFGMTLLEIISGRRNMETREGAHKCFFPVWAAMKISNGSEILTLVDERLEGRVEEEEVRRAAYTAVWCIQDNEEKRPRMGKVVQMLEGTVHVNVPPVPFALKSMADET